MPQARKNQVIPEVTPYYHCISRCVRRAYLCGFDQLTGRSFEHRRQWIVDRIRHLSQAFAIDICAYAVMSNHFHLVIKIQQQQALKWTSDEVINRWTSIFTAPALIKSYQAGTVLTESEQEALNRLVETWRLRLHSLSWFMRAINEHIARMSNQEDACKGRFWEGRFVSQAILDEAALLAVMAYVDLNPIRAGLANTPESSEFTSIHERIRIWRQQHQKKANTSSPRSHIALDKPLLNFRDSTNNTEAIPCLFQDYIELVDWVGRRLRSGQVGRIPSPYPPILQRLAIDESQFLQHMKRPGYGFYRVIGSLRTIRHVAERFKVKFFKGQTRAATLFLAT